jgi:hypothetical protein
MARVPDLAAPAFGKTRKPTVPLPEPLAPDVTVIQDTRLVAVHGHPGAVDSDTENVPPAALTD